MYEIELPCCGASATLEDGAASVTCDDCGVTLELAPDAVAVGEHHQGAQLVALAA